MKRILIVIAFLGLISGMTTINAQSGLSLEASQLYTSFKFTDSQENTLNSEYSGIFTGAYGLGYRYILGNGLMVRASLGIRNAGATMVYDNTNYTWDLKYADFKLGGGYMLKKDRISPYLNVSGYYGFMLSGYQTINNEDFDIKKSESMQTTDYGVCITPGIEISFTGTLSSFVELNYIMGLQNLEKDDAQKSTNIAYGLSVGLSFYFIR